MIANGCLGLKAWKNMPCWMTEYFIQTDICRKVQNVYQTAKRTK